MLNFFKRLFDSALPTPICQEKAVFCALACHPMYPVRIVTGNTDKGPHAQCKALIDNEWKWVQFVDGNMVVGEQELEFTGYVKEFKLGAYLIEVGTFIKETEK